MDYLELAEAQAPQVDAAGQQMRRFRASALLRALQPPVPMHPHGEVMETAMGTYPPPYPTRPQLVIRHMAEPNLPDDRGSYVPYPASPAGWDGERDAAAPPYVREV